jgi:replicative superfamily II helicase
VLCTPTGSGKTTVAECALIGDLFGRHDLDSGLQALGDDGALAIYLVPSRALAPEVERRLQEDLADVGSRRLVVTGLYGGTDWGPTDGWLTSTDPTILVCTYEKAEALLRFLGPIFMRRVRTVIIDEAHCYGHCATRGGSQVLGVAVRPGSDPPANASPTPNPGSVPGGGSGGLGTRSSPGAASTTMCSRPLGSR